MIPLACRSGDIAVRRLICIQLDKSSFHASHRVLRHASIVSSSQSSPLSSARNRKLCSDHHRKLYHSPSSPKGNLGFTACLAHSIYESAKCLTITSAEQPSHSEEFTEGKSGVARLNGVEKISSGQHVDLILLKGFDPLDLRINTLSHRTSLKL